MLFQGWLNHHQPNQTHPPVFFVVVLYIHCEIRFRYQIDSKTELQRAVQEKGSYNPQPTGLSLIYHCVLIDADNKVKKGGKYKNARCLRKGSILDSTNTSSST